MRKGQTVANKQQRMQNAANYRDLMAGVRPLRQCHNCKIWHRAEGHFVPPSFGESGFYICTKPAAPTVDEKGE
jgi:hypothetical protein